MGARANGVRATLLATRTALAFVVLLAIVSLFSDMTYEGARSLHGQFLVHGHRRVTNASPGGRRGSMREPRPDSKTMLTATRFLFAKSML